MRKEAGGEGRKGGRRDAYRGVRTQSWSDEKKKPRGQPEGCAHRREGEVGGRRARSLCLTNSGTRTSSK